MTPNKLPPLPVTDEMILTAVDGFNEAAADGELLLTSLRDKERMRFALQDALRQSQSLPAGAVAGLVGKWRMVAEKQRLRARRNGAIDDETGEAFFDGMAERSEYCADELEQALQADAREKGEAVAWRVDTPYGYGYTFAEEIIDYMNSRDPQPRWPADRAPEALARLREYLTDLSYPDGSDPLDDLSAVALATQPAQASEKDNG